MTSNSNASSWKEAAWGLACGAFYGAASPLSSQPCDHLLPFPFDHQLSALVLDLNLKQMLFSFFMYNINCCFEDLIPSKPKCKLRYEMENVSALFAIVGSPCLQT